MHQHDDEVGTLGYEVGSLGVDRLHDAIDLDVGDAGRAHERGQVFGDRTHEAHLDVAELLDPGGRYGRLPGRAHLEVRRDVLPLGTAVGVRVDVVGSHDPVDEVVVTLVEFVVSDGGHLQTGGIERVDGGLVVLDERLEGRSADEVAGRGEDGVGVLGAEQIDGARELRRTGLSALVEDPAWKSLVAMIWMSVVAAWAGGAATRPAPSATAVVSAPTASLRRREDWSGCDRARMCLPLRVG